MVRRPWFGGRRLRRLWAKNGGVAAMVRFVHPQHVREDLIRMQRLNEQLGIPFLDGYFQRIEQDGWIARNPEIYHLFEERGVLRGYVGLLPVTEESYRAFAAGRRFPVRHLKPDDLLTREEYARAKLAGVHLWIESFCCRDTATAELVAGWAFEFLTRLHIRGLLVATSCPRDEELCRWWGFTPAYDDQPCPTGMRRLWYGDLESVIGEAGPPLGRPVPLRCLFFCVQRRFASPPLLGLSVTQRRVAQRFYLEEQTERQIACAFGVKLDTVKKHLQRVREKAAPVVGSTLSRTIAAWLHEHPAELLSEFAPSSEVSPKG